jgi:hypothetical protein
MPVNAMHDWHIFVHDWPVFGVDEVINEIETGARGRRGSLVK